MVFTGPLLVIALFIVIIGTYGPLLGIAVFAWGVISLTQPANRTFGVVLVGLCVVGAGAGAYIVKGPPRPNVVYAVNCALLGAALLGGVPAAIRAAIVVPSIRRLWDRGPGMTTTCPSCRVHYPSRYYFARNDDPTSPCTGCAAGRHGVEP
jgi:hypothetical protein